MGLRRTAQPDSKSCAPSAARLSRLILYLLAGGLVTALLALHGWLLWGRIARGELAVFAVALRWLAAALLITVSVALRRRGIPLLWGRRALALWLLVGLLHWSAPAVGTDEAASPSAPWRGVQVLFLLPSAGAPLVVALGLLFASALRAESGQPPPPRSTARLEDPPFRPLRDGVLLLLSPRAPPA